MLSFAIGTFIGMCLGIVCGVLLVGDQEEDDD